jgi:16S rRNA (adenine1518-N6/adenine1519-N6)-dimethyltransferase
MRNPRIKKGLGQHHLVSGQLCRPLVDFLRPAGLDVIEIGPGGGVLTAELMREGARVVAWEIDVAWAFELERRLGEPLRIVIGDALELPWDRLSSPTLVVGNLPYNVATVLIRAMLRHGESIPRAAFLVQLEVGQRLVAGPGDKDYGALSVLTAASARARLLGRVRPGSFRPPPRVVSAFVGFELRAPEVPEDEYPLFVELVHGAFSQRRKKLRNSLGSTLGREGAAAILGEAGVDGDKRAQELELAAFLAMHRAGIALGLLHGRG